MVAGMAVLWFFAGPVAADLCPKCKGKAYILTVGVCKECGGAASSGAFKLCRKCSVRLGQCQHCRAPLKGKPVELDEKANGKTVTAEIGQHVIVRLRGNPTTGYRWDVRKLKGDAIKQVGKVKYVQDKAPKRMVSVGGMFIFTFRAAKAGKAALALAYARPWEKKKPPARTFKATVEVKPATKK